MRDEFDDDDEIDEYYYNDFSGQAEYVVQAGPLNGGVELNDVDISHHSHYYDRDYDTFEYSIMRGAGFLFFLALFIAGSTYAALFAELDLAFFDWVKLAISSGILTVVFVTSEHWIFDNPSFGFLRFFVSVILIILGYNYGENLQALQELNSIISGWLVWKF
ncbi:hypothetical protein REH65_10680 [Saccharopolyspora sp. ID03-671]|uniref:hypothetical protein n=1 Tax=Saccharopolyspora sp. ID03-671 TaxID=3073066 RepID=UPI003243BF2E